jgi:hypothetical protein
MKSKTIKLPFKYELFITSYYIGLHYTPLDLRPGGLIFQTIFKMRIPFTKVPEGVVWSGAPVWTILNKKEQRKAKTML